MLIPKLESAYLVVSLVDRATFTHLGRNLTALRLGLSELGVDVEESVYPVSALMLSTRETPDTDRIPHCYD